MTLELLVSLNLCIMNFIATGMRYQHFFTNPEAYVCS